MSGGARRSLVLLLIFLAAVRVASAQNAGFVHVDGPAFSLNGDAYYFAGANFWYGLNLASAGPGGDRGRLERELDALSALGITNLRVMAGSEGPDSEPWRAVPSLQPAPGMYNVDLLDGLDFLLAEMNERGMRAVMCLTNFWQWSGGMAQYVSWNGGGSIPYPPPEPGGDWDAYQDYASDFYSNEGAMEDFRSHAAFLIGRQNPYTGTRYEDDPTIMAWELANEPRGFNNNAAAFNAWIDETAAFIKTLDGNHLVTTGCEGDTPWPAWNGLDFAANHDGPDIDYATIHIWPENWGWYDPTNPEGTFATALVGADTYFATTSRRLRRSSGSLSFSRSSAWPETAGATIPLRPCHGETRSSVPCSATFTTRRFRAAPVVATTSGHGPVKGAPRSRTAATGTSVTHGSATRRTSARAGTACTTPTRQH
jgi:mannan endo-1,4-beta-mannosidase